MILKLKSTGNGTLTRARSGESRVPNDLMVEYYQQRANAGLILTEATVIGSKP